jgi:EAL domain-containing protein (putative c-di-GMP-specific phosphodiesterase class I)
LNPRFLDLEISETTVMNNIELATSILDNIRMTGVKISLDHFGTGYTSITALKLFPINTIKIDQTFIRGVPTIPNDMAITSGLISLAHNLGFEVVAQGVETAEQVQFLASQNCDIVQGYFLSHPQSAQKIILQFRKLREEAMI